jgi:hypothetical protein
MYRDFPSQNVTQNPREIPKEMLFRISDARQDTIKKNKWWFKLPEEWTNRSFKDKVLGLRSIKLVPKWFVPMFGWGLAFFPDHNPETKASFAYTVSVGDLFIGATTTIHQIEDYFNNIYTDFIKKFGIIDQSPDDTERIIKKHTYRKYCTYYYQETPSDPSKIICVLVFNSVEGYAPGPVGFTKNMFHTPNQDALDFFGPSLFPSVLKPEELSLTVMWDRRELYITSSLALSSDKNGYLGHSREADYIPIKYYRLDSDDKEFWIELFSEREHSCEVDDLQKVSDLYLEMIFMYNAEAML